MRVHGTSVAGLGGVLTQLLPPLALALSLPACLLDDADIDAPSFDLELGHDEDAVAGKADSGATQVVFLNFGGARLRSGDCSDAPSDCSRLVAGTQDFAPFAVSAQWDRPKVVAAITRCVGMFFTDMDAHFVTTRPASGPYTMMLIGAIYPTQLGFPHDGAGPYGRAPIDCGNANKSDIGFLLLEDDVDPDFYYMCRSIAHELGHTFGMVHTHGEHAVVADRVDVMCETDACRHAAATGQAQWIALDRPMGASGACDGTEHQNTYARLRGALGAPP